MTTAQELLKMIETVSPDDAVKLDEIDALVDTYAANTNGWVLTFNKMRLELGLHHYETVRPDGKTILFIAPEYTRSRDALKRIRPIGWYFDIHPWISGVGYTAGKFNVGLRFCYAEDLPTEELAELHAIIQAIEYERTHDNQP